MDLNDNRDIVIPVSLNIQVTVSAFRQLSVEQDVRQVGRYWGGTECNGINPNGIRQQGGRFVFVRYAVELDNDFQRIGLALYAENAWRRLVHAFFGRIFRQGIYFVPLRDSS